MMRHTSLTSRGAFSKKKRPPTHKTGFNKKERRNEKQERERHTERERERERGVSPLLRAAQKHTHTQKKK
jgi:hypothetical protein